MTFFDLLTRVLLLQPSNTLVCVQIVLHHEPSDLLSVQLLPSLSSWKEEYGLALIVDLCDIPLKQLALFNFY